MLSNMASIFDHLTKLITFRWKRGVGVLIITVHPNTIAGLFMRRAENQHYIHPQAHSHSHKQTHTHVWAHILTQSSWEDGHT